MRRAAGILVILVLLAPSLAQAKKRRVADWKFWLAVGVVAAATVADIETTRRGIERGAVEGNPLFGRRPGRPRLYLQSGGMTAGVVVLSYYLKRGSPERNPRGLWLAPMGAAATTHGIAAYRNTHVCPSGTVCR